MGLPIDMERNGRGSIGCWAYHAILSFDLNLGLSSSNSEIAAFQDGMTDWHGSKGM